MLLACADPAPTARLDGELVVIEGHFDEVEILDEAGLPVERRRLAEPVERLELALEPGRYRLRVEGVELAVERPAQAPVRAEVQVAPGAAWAPLAGEIPVPAVGVAEVAVRVTAGPDFPARVESSLGPVDLAWPGQVELRRLRLTDTTEVFVGSERATLRPVPVDPAALEVGEPVFPAGPDGDPDLGRPAGAAILPDPLWDGFVRRHGLGSRRRDEYAPVGWAALPLHNRGEQPVDVVASLRFADPAFRPRLRDADGGTGEVQVLVRVPAGSSSAVVLPVFVAADAAIGSYRGELRLRPLGAGDDRWRGELRVDVSRGDPVARVGFAGAMGGATLGFGWFLLRLRGWLESSPTSELMTIALFGSALFVTGTASDLLSMAVGALLGPFATVLTGLVGDLARVVLLGTLLGLRPKAGTLALSTVSGYLLRGLAMGSFAVADLLYLGVSIGAQEAMAWIVGASRGRVPGFTRLALLFGLSGVLTTLVGLWLHIVLYRLYFAGWYVLFQVAVPGLLYPVIAAAIASRSIRALREVQA